MGTSIRESRFSKCSDSSSNHYSRQSVLLRNRAYSRAHFANVILASGKYFVTVDIDGGPASARWYDLWTDAVAVTGVCVQNDKWGVSTRQGKLRACF